MSNANGAKYYYDSNDVRFQKQANGETTNYYMDGSKFLGEVRTKGEGESEKKTNLRYFYDTNGICGMRCGDKNYNYVCDAEGNVVLLMQDDKVEARYEYDVYGKCTVRDGNGLLKTESEFIGNVNPFRWKGHYYDVETGFYYIEGSYYDPETGSFLNARSVSSILGDPFSDYTLDRNGIMCDNIFELLPYMYAIYTMQEMSADPDYDITANRTWWESFVQWIMTPFLWVDSLDNNVKMLAGVALLALAAALMIATGGAPAAVVGALCCSMLTSIAIGGIGGGIISAINGGSFAEGLLDGASDAIFWGGLFAFVGAALQSVKRVAEGALQSKIRVADCTGQCFIAGTLVLTEEGYKKIEEIKIGDKVLSYDEETGEQGYKEVVRLFRNKTEEWYHIVAGEEEIVCTGGHPFYVEGEGFVEAKDLKISDVLLLSDGESVTVKQIGYEKLVEAETTYNFEVRDYHTYYVSESGILVHNDCLVRVGRWMSQDEYEKMLKSGRIQESYTGTTHVSFPADKMAYYKQAPKGSLYVEFDVVKSAVKKTGLRWAKIIGPNSLEGRYFAKLGNPILDMPKFYNILLLGVKR